MNIKINNFKNKINIDGTLKEFLNNLSLVFLYKIIHSVLVTLCIILSARILGPADFGKLNLINNISLIIVLPIIMGLNVSMYKFLPACNEEEKNSFISTSFILNLFLIVVYLLIYYLGYQAAFHKINISQRNWNICLLVTITLDLYYLSESFLRGQKKYLLISKIRVVSGILKFIIMMLIYYLCQLKNITGYFLAHIISELFFSITALFKTKIKINSFSRGILKKLYTYSAINALNMFLSTILYTSDLVIVNSLCSPKLLGIYSVYQGFVKNIFSILFFEIFLVVFLPTISNMDKKKLHQQVKKYTPWLFSIIILGLGGISYLTLFLFGKKYGINLSYIFMTSISIGLYTIYQLYNNIYIMEGKDGAKLSLIPNLIVFPFSLILQYYATKNWAITGTMSANIMTNILLIIIFCIVIKDKSE